MADPWRRLDPNTDPDPDPHSEGGGGPPGGGWLRVLVLAVAAGLLIWGLTIAFPDSLGAEDNRIRLIYLSSLLMVLIMLGAGRRVGSVGNFVRNFAIWVAIALVLALGYSYRAELEDAGQRLVGNVDPAGAQEVGKGVAFTASRNGHFYIRAEVDGVPVRFMVDSGATNIVLSPSDARRIGLEPSYLSYDQSYRTANGIGRGASVRLHWIAVGPIELRDVPASVNEAEMGISLLGMEFLRRLSGWSVEGDRLILYP